MSEWVRFVDRGCARNHVRAELDILLAFEPLTLDGNIILPPAAIVGGKNRRFNEFQGEKHRQDKGDTRASGFARPLVGT